MSSIIHVKSSNGQKYSLDVNLEEMTVGALKGEMSSKVDIPAASQRLIYRGRVLKDDSTLSSYGVEADHTIHLVRGAAPPGSAPSPPSTTLPTAATPAAAGSAPAVSPVAGMGGLNLGNFNFGALGGAAGPGFGAGAGAGAGGDWMGGMGGLGAGLNLPAAQQELMRNPEAMRSLMNSPAAQSLMNNPDLMRSLVATNPQMREVMERNPQLAHVLNDPAMLRQSIAAAQNPEIMREMMRTSDRAMSNLDAMPEGFNMLRRQFEDIQEPLMDAMMPPPPSVGNATATPPAAGEGGEAMNTAPLPNPWGPPPAAGAAAAAGGGAGTVRGERMGWQPLKHGWGWGLCSWRRVRPRPTCGLWRLPPHGPGSGGHGSHRPGGHGRCGWHGDGPLPTPDPAVRPPYAADVAVHAGQPRPTRPDGGLQPRYAVGYGGQPRDEGGHAGPGDEAEVGGSCLPPADDAHQQPGGAAADGSAGVQRWQQGTLRRFMPPSSPSCKTWASLTDRPTYVSCKQPRAM